MPPMISLDVEFVAQYARPPSDNTVKQVISLHETVRSVLGDSTYATLLQGSYKNDTALAELNDVDIVAVHRETTAAGLHPWVRNDWNELFHSIEAKLDASPHYRGKWVRRDKCIRLNTGIKADIVPAVRVGAATEDPIAIYSFSKSVEKKNWPRGHYDRGAAKSGKTNGAFKQTVRLFKRWARSHFGQRKVAPSYYLESLLFSISDHLFTGNLASDFVSIGNEVIRRFPPSTWYGGLNLQRIAGEGNLLSAAEWTEAAFSEFRTSLQSSLPYARSAISASTGSAARDAWQRAFDGQ